jgi:hypothetical protein
MVSQIWRDPMLEYSYYRRGVRPNELFFVYDSTDLEALRQFLPPHDSHSLPVPTDSGSAAFNSTPSRRP